MSCPYNQWHQTLRFLQWDTMLPQLLLLPRNPLDLLTPSQRPWLPQRRTLRKEQNPNQRRLLSATTMTTFLVTMMTMAQMKMGRRWVWWGEWAWGPFGKIQEDTRTDTVVRAHPFPLLAHTHIEQQPARKHFHWGQDSCMQDLHAMFTSGEINNQVTRGLYNATSFLSGLRPDSIGLWVCRTEIFLLCNSSKFPLSFCCLSRHFWLDLSVQWTFLTDFQWTNSKPAASPLEMTSKYQQNSSRHSQWKSDGLHTVVVIIII